MRRLTIIGDRVETFTFVHYAWMLRAVEKPSNLNNLNIFIEFVPSEVRVYSLVIKQLAVFQWLCSSVDDIYSAKCSLSSHEITTYYCLREILQDLEKQGIYEICLFLITDLISFEINCLHCFLTCERLVNPLSFSTKEHVKKITSWSRGPIKVKDSTCWTFRGTQTTADGYISFFLPIWEEKHCIDRILIWELTCQFTRSVRGRGIIK